MSTHVDQLKTLIVPQEARVFASAALGFGSWAVAACQTRGEFEYRMPERKISESKEDKPIKRRSANKKKDKRIKKKTSE